MLARSGDIEHRAPEICYEAEYRAALLWIEALDYGPRER